MEIFKLFGRILVDSTEAEKSIQKTGEAANEMGDSFADTLQDVKDWSSAVIEIAKDVGTAFWDMATETAESMSSIVSDATKFDMNTSALQELQYALEQTGVDVGILEEASKNLKSTGLDIGLEEAIEDCMNLSTEAQRTKKAIDLFGEDVAYEMNGLFKTSLYDFQQLRLEAEKTGSVLSSNVLSSAADFEKTLNSAQIAMEGIKSRLASKIYPVITEMLETLIDKLPIIEEKVTEIVNVLMQYLSPIIESIKEILNEYILPAVRVIWNIITELAPAVEALLGWLLQCVEALLSFLLGDWDGFYAHFDKAYSYFEKLTKAISSLGLTDAFQRIGESIEKFLNNAIEKAKQAIENFKNWLGLGDGSDGSHASGLNYVPYDGYQATLHKGETVLNAQNTQSLISDLKNAIGSANTAQTITIPISLDGTQIAKVIYSPLQTETSRHGTSLVTA